MAQTRDGGKPNVKPGNYSPPQGPTSLMRNQVGIGGANHGNKQSSIQVESASDPGEFTGRPGIGGTVHPCGSQRDADD